MELIKKLSTQTLFLFLIIVFLLSCKSNDKKRLIDTGQRIIYHIGYPIRSRSFFSIRGRDYVAFYDFVTHKKAEVFTIYGKHLFTIPFEKIEKCIPGGITWLQAISLDTFAVMSNYSNKILLVNKKGEIIYQKDYSKYLLNQVELYPPLNIIGDNFYCTIDYKAPIGFYKKPTEKDWLRLNKKTVHYYNLFMDSSFYDKNQHVSFQLNNLYSRFAKDDDEIIEGFNILFAKDKRYFTSDYTDTIYVFNKKFQLIKAKNIKSKFYKIDCRPVKFLTIYKNPDSLNKNFYNHSFIGGLQYDKYRNVFYCMVLGPENYKKHYKPYSIIVLDANLNQLYEQNFTNNTYNNSLYCGKEGIYLGKVNKNDINNHTYAIFNFK